MIDPKLGELIALVISNAAREGCDGDEIITSQNAIDGLVDYMQQERYTQNGGSHCPVCCSPNISRERYTKGHGDSWEGCTCLSCKCTWNNVYDLIGFSDLTGDYV